MITEHRETSVIINDQLNQLYLALYLQNYLLAYCSEAFSVTEFLQHKIKYAQPRINISCYASGKKQSSSDVANAELYDTLKRWRDMIQISGFGKAKSEKYGDDILELVKDYCDRNNLESNMSGKVGNPKK